MIPDNEDLKRILAEAAAIKKRAERDAYLDEACRGDAQLRTRIERLLRAHDSAGDFLNESVQLTPDGRDSIQEGPGTIIGHYKLLEEIGEGGFGVVFMAEQTEPIRRKVALKIVKPGMDTRQVIARFEAERQALAMMDHPNIAQVYDAGATETGRPFFVMELVQGIPITEFCDANELSPTERLKLFMSVCSALQHAHQKGIIHRDIKPSNILVTMHDAKPLPKVIDFGTAKALEEPLTEETMFTPFGKMIGTPQYMSPEQAEFGGLDVDTRADIYSLGVLLYELLTGTTPFEALQLRAAAFDEMMRIIRQDEPPKPSTRLSTLGQRVAEIAKHRQMDANALQRSLCGDLDWIIMKALEKDPARRYGTASELGDDIQRHLEHHPVLAGPPSATYRARKYVRRHKMGVTLAAGLSTAVIAGLIIALIGLAQARRERDHALAAEIEAQAHLQRANTEAERSAQVARFMKEMLAGVGPSVARGRDTAMLKEILDQTVERLEEELADQPEVELELRHTIAKVYWELGTTEDAISTYREVAEMIRSLNGSEDPSLAEALHELAECLRRYGLSEKAEHTERQALAILEKAYGREHPMIGASLMTLGSTLSGQQKHEAAEAALRESLEIMRKTLGEEHPETGLCWSRLGKTLETWGKGAEAEEAYRYAIEIQRMALGKPPTGLLAPEVELAWTLSDLARLLAVQNRWSEAETIYREAVETMGKVLPEGHSDAIAMKLVFGKMLVEHGDLAEAESNYRKALMIARKTFGNKHHLVAMSVNRLGNTLEAQEKLAEAEDADREALAICKELRPEYHRNIAIMTGNLARVLCKQGKLDEARTLCLDLLEQYGAGSEQKFPHVTGILAQIHGRLGAWDDAVKLYQICIEADPDDHRLWYQAHAAALAAGQEDIVRRLCRDMLSRFADTQDPAICEQIARSVLLTPEGSSELSRAVEMAERAFDENPESLGALCAKGMAAYRLANYKSAAELLAPLSKDANSQNGCLAGYYLAMSLQQQEDTNAARRVLQETNDRTAEVLRAGDLGATWYDCCRTLVARSEAERLIMGQEVSPPVTTESLAAASREQYQ